MWPTLIFSSLISKVRSTSPWSSLLKKHQRLSHPPTVKFMLHIMQSGCSQPGSCWSLQHPVLLLSVLHTPCWPDGTCQQCRNVSYFQVFIQAILSVQMLLLILFAVLPLTLADPVFTPFIRPSSALPIPLSHSATGNSILCYNISPITLPLMTSSSM